MTTTATYRVDLGKHAAEYLVIVDDSDPFPGVADYTRKDRLPERRVVFIERLADDRVEQQLQVDELEADCREAGGALTLLTRAAVSYGHAAQLAVWEHVTAAAADRMAEVIDSHLARGSRGWVAVRIADGSSDGELYLDVEGARAAQADPVLCTYFPISPSSSWPVEECEEHLQLMTHLQHGCMVHGAPTCH